MAYYSEIKTFRIQRDCPDKGIMLKWRNPYGAFDSHLFDGDTDQEQEVGDYQTMQQADQRHNTVLGKQGTEYLYVRAVNATPNQLKVFWQLVRSSEVYRVYPLSSGKPAEKIEVVSNNLPPIALKEGAFDVELKLKVSYLNALKN